jgi:WD40 repeat protein
LSVSFSPDGTRIVTGALDKNDRLWDAGTGESGGEPLRGYPSSVNSVLISPDGTRIVTGSQDYTIRLCNAWTGEPLQQCAVSNSSAFSDEHCTIEATATMTLNTSNNHSISFSSNSIHALRNTSEIMEPASHNHRSSTSFVLDVDDGWVGWPQMSAVIQGTTRFPTLIL